MRILVTAIGSMSAACVISSLKEAGHTVIGCDIYPGEWHYETQSCDQFYQAPLASAEEYIPFLTNVVKENNIDFIFPLTDLEVDALVSSRSYFRELNCILCISEDKVISVARNKKLLADFFLDDEMVPSIYSYSTNNCRSINKFSNYPYIVKPCNGRSSNGLRKVHNKQELELYIGLDNFIIQDFINGPIFTVDYLRQSSTNNWLAVPRMELIRTANGAGLTIEICNDESLMNLTNHIGQQLGVNGCVNMEFILCNNKYYLIDVNPRFSAGVAFSKLAGIDFVINHLKCFSAPEESISTQVPLTKEILIKSFHEVKI